MSTLDNVPFQRITESGTHVQRFFHSLETHAPGTSLLLVSLITILGQSVKRASSSVFGFPLHPGSTVKVSAIQFIRGRITLTIRGNVDRVVYLSNMLVLCLY